MGKNTSWIRRFFGRQTSAEDRVGGRVIVEQPGELDLSGLTVEGTIHDVGLRGAFFATSARPLPGSHGILRRTGGNPINVQVVWANRRGASGVGLRFGSTLR